MVSAFAGFSSHSAYMMATRMMRTHEAAYEFVHKLLEQLKPLVCLDGDTCHLSLVL